MNEENNTSEENLDEQNEGIQAPEEPAEFDPISVEQSKIQKLNSSIKEELGKVIVGQEELMDLLTVALLIKGHILIEGVPGIAKTLTAKLFARTIDASYSRMQFTPDLMPSDVIGTNVFNTKTSDFEFKRGPIFADIVVVDEINRSPAKTQSALFEVMQENQVTVDGKTNKMGEAFMVIATQNPIDNEGTYKLPEAQLDRFLFKINLGYPSGDEEVAILHRFKNDFTMRAISDVNRVVDITELLELRKDVEDVDISDQILKYIAEIISETRNNGDLFLGASPRAAVWMMKASKAAAILSGRDFVTPDDVRWVTRHVLNHRIIVSPQREMEGVPADTILQQIIEKIEVPR